MEMHSLAFTNNKAIYKITEDWEAEDNENSVGITVNANEKKFHLAGITFSKNGSLGSLADKGNLMPNDYWNDTEKG